jgi:hypothetical protein
MGERMNRAQGNTRRAPDGFLHIQNFTVTKHAGMAGVVYTHILDAHQRSLVEGLLIEKACSDTCHQWNKGNIIDPIHHFKHDVWRFRKDWLKENFREVVHAATKVMKNPVIETFKEKLFAERESLTY